MCLLAKELCDDRGGGGYERSRIETQLARLFRARLALYRHADTRRFRGRGRERGGRRHDGLLGYTRSGVRRRVHMDKSARSAPEAFVAAPRHGGGSSLGRGVHRHAARIRARCEEHDERRRQRADGDDPVGAGNIHRGRSAWSMAHLRRRRRARAWRALHRLARSGDLADHHRGRHSRRPRHVYFCASPADARKPRIQPD